ncbi:MAG: hypothetical protein CML24_12945 [Rhizobiales bacterium]|nr:hypothetical protein [Hyphomicrobiales bacterium]
MVASLIIAGPDVSKDPAVLPNHCRVRRRAWAPGRARGSEEREVIEPQALPATGSRVFARDDGGAWVEVENNGVARSTHHRCRSLRPG